MSRALPSGALVRGILKGEAVALRADARPPRVRVLAPDLHAELRARIVARAGELAADLEELERRLADVAKASPWTQDLGAALSRLAGRTRYFGKPVEPYSGTREIARRKPAELLVAMGSGLRGYRLGERDLCLACAAEVKPRMELAVSPIAAEQVAEFLAWDGAEWTCDGCGADLSRGDAPGRSGGQP